MLSTGCHWLKLQQGPSAEGAVPKYPSRATSSLPYKRKGYSEKPWGDRNTKCLFSPVSFIKGLSLTIVSVLSYCPLQSLAALHPPHTRREPAPPLPQTAENIPRPRLESQWYERVPGWASLHSCVSAHRDSNRDGAACVWSQQEVGGILKEHHSSHRIPWSWTVLFSVSRYVLQCKIKISLKHCQCYKVFGTVWFFSKELFTLSWLLA